MKFLDALRKGMRARGVYLTADEALLLLRLAQFGGYAASLSEEEADLLRRFEQRCAELERL